MDLGDRRKYTVFKAIRMANFTMKGSVDREQKLTKDLLSFGPSNAKLLERRKRTLRTEDWWSGKKTKGV